MPAISASAPGKVILLGEHAVVYGQPAIAVPVSQVKARAIISPIILETNSPREIRINAPDIGLNSKLDMLPTDHPIVKAILLVKEQLEISQLPSMQIHITSSIPIASGMGSGAAVSVAIIRALASFLGKDISTQNVSEIAFQVEKLYHGTPSGIDNTVIAYAKPIYFQHGVPFQPMVCGAPLVLIIADSGTRSSTSRVVQYVRQQQINQPEKYRQLFAKVGELVNDARQAITDGNILSLAALMFENHQLLQEIGVSTNQLDYLVTSAMNAGALGSKLSGAGWGGNVICLVQPSDAEYISQKLLHAGAKQTIITQIC